MTDHDHTPATVRNFSLAFEQMCSMVAISQTKSAHDTLRELILQCLVILPDDKFRNSQQIVEVFDILFGLHVAEHEVQFALDSLIHDGSVSLVNGVVISFELRAEMQSRIDGANTLEEEVKRDWLNEIGLSFPLLPLEVMWKLLRSYLAKAFRRHGIQAILILDPASENDPEHTESLSGLLDHVLGDVPIEFRPDARRAVSGFLARAGQNPKRAKYIAQLADGAFNYYTLTIAPDIAAKFRQQLLPLTIFLDTNFLFGILDLTINPQVAVSNALLGAIQKHKLPFNLRYHKSTERELTTSIGHYEDVLQSRRWPRQLSRAAASSRNLSGVELKYHQRHAETGIDVENFFRPYRHVDVLLGQQGIDVYIPQLERLNERADLLHEYQDYLKSRRREKLYQLVDHDMTVLDAVRQLQATAKSSLEAGAILITCDFALYGFDVESSRKLEKPPSTVLPNVFWQILRPFIPTDSDFDRSFAETFAIPQFRTIGSGAALACSRMLHILAGYQNFTEETAARMLSNDLLVDRLRKAKDNIEFQQIVDSAIAEENAALVEENAALATQLGQERMQRHRELEQAQSALRQREQIFKEQLGDSQSKYQDVVADIDHERTARQQAEKRAASEAAARKKAEITAEVFAVLTAVLLSVVLIIGLEIFVRILPWTWLLRHPNSYALQVGGGLLITFAALGAFHSRWRKWYFLAGAFGVLLAVVPLLGGPTR